MKEEKVTIVDGLIKREPFETLTTHMGLFCPYCGMEEGEHPDNVISYTFEETLNKCFDCSEVYIVERQIVTTYISKKRNESIPNNK